MKYNEDYFKKLNYTDYLYRRDRYLRLASELHELLDKLRLVHDNVKILDFGCAVGFLMEGFRELGYKEIYGWDISSWAVSKAQEKGLNILKKIEELSFDIIICLDVLEHMADQEIFETFTNLKSNMMIIRIPCSEDGKKFVLDISNRDETHINLKIKQQWVNLITELGYQ